MLIFSRWGLSDCLDVFRFCRRVGPSEREAVFVARPRIARSPAPPPLRTEEGAPSAHRDIGDKVVGDERTCNKMNRILRNFG